MADELINDWSTPHFHKTLEDAEAGLGRLVKLITEANQTAKSAEGLLSMSTNLKQVVEQEKILVTANGELKTSYQQLGAATQFWNTWKERSNGSTDKEIIGTGKILKLKSEEEKVRERTAKATEAENKAKLAGLKVDKERETQQRRNTVAQEAAHDSLKTLSVTLEAHRKSYALLTAAERDNEHIGGVLLTRIQQLDKQLKATDSTLGVYRRNVGNYSSAFNGLGNSIQQVARELPNFAISFRTGIQALSNNLPILADEIRRVRVENEALRAEGKPTTSVLKQITGAVFNWQTALIAVITALVAYAPQIAEFISGTGDAAKKQEDLKKATEETTAALEAQIDTLFKARQREGSRQDIGEAAAKRRLDLLKAQGASEKDILDAQLAFFAARRKNIENEIGSYKLIRNEINRAGQFFRDREKAEGLTPGSLNDLFSQSVQQTLRNELKLTADEAKKQADVIASSYGTALSPVRDIQTRILDLNEELKNADSDGNVAKAELLRKAHERAEKQREKDAERAKKLAEERQRALDEETKLTLEKTKGMYEKRKAIADDAYRDERRSVKERLNNVDKSMLDEVSIVQLNGAIQHKTREEIEADITEVVLKYSRLRTEIIDKETKRQAAVTKANLGGITGNGQGQTREQFEKEEQEKLKALDFYNDKAIESAYLTASINSSITQRRIQEIDAEIEAINRRTETEIKAIEKSGLTAEKKEAAVAAAKGKAEAKITELENDRRKRQQRAAQFEKAITITQIIASTALAIVKQLAATPLPAGAGFVAAIAAAGALQLGAAIAAPIPQYEEGTQGKPHKGGPAVLFEGNKPELVVENGKAWVGAKEGVYNLSRGAEVFNKEQILELSRHYTLGLPNLIPQQSGGMDTRELQRTMERVEDAIRNKKETTWQITGMGLYNIDKIGNSIQKRLHNLKH